MVSFTDLKIIFSLINLVSNNYWQLNARVAKARVRTLFDIGNYDKCVSWGKTWVIFVTRLVV